jgi:ABC-type dipeptide/oligopeptide/nickel transport system permease component
MWRFAARRLVLAVLVSISVSLICFSLLRLSGDLARALAGPQATADDVTQIARIYGLDRPVYTQYLDWVWRLLQGDLGQSFFGATPVLDAILSRAPVTLTLAVGALTLALAVAIPLGVLAALRPNTALDRGVAALAVTGQAMPGFWLGLVLIWVFGVRLRLLPITGSESWRHFILPTAVLAYSAVPALMRLVRAGMVNVLASDYIRTARAMGLAPLAILFKYALRNALVPVIALAAVQLGSLLAGSVVIEAVFGLNGIGQLAWTSISRNDFPVVQSIVLVTSLIYIALTFAGDLLNAAVDPRIRGSG